jgi:hypothetical protein
MNGMARRKKPDEDTPIPATASMPASRPGDRHKPRRMVGLTPEEHRMLGELAERNVRPLLWELRIALKHHFAANGLKPKQRGHP